MNDNTALWDKLGKTDPSHTKAFSRAGGFKGTAIKPMFSYLRMTEEFGPCGVGWGINKPDFQVVPAGDDTLVFCTVSIWHKNRDNIVYGVGGDKVASKNKNGSFTDDEAFKKAFTDAVTNALKLIGVGADVHMGLFDDQKYVNTMRQEFAQTAQPETPAQPDTNAIKADQLVAKAVTHLGLMKAEEMHDWWQNKAQQETVDALKWVKRNYPDKWAEIQGLGFDIEL